jgi:hypothetical protein
VLLCFGGCSAVQVPSRLLTGRNMFSVKRGQERQTTAHINVVRYWLGPLRAEHRQFCHRFVLGGGEVLSICRETATTK